MPKKARSAAAATTPARRKAVLAFTAGLFRDTAAAMERAESAGARFRVLSERLAGHGSELRALDRRTDPRLLDAIAAGAGRVAALLLQGNNTDSAPPREAAERAADGLDRLSDAFRSGAASLHLLPAKARAKKSRVDIRIEGLHEEGVDVAQDCFGKALALRRAAQVEQPAERWYFRLPELAQCDDGKGGCGCGGTRVILPAPVVPPAPDGRRGRAPAGAKADLPSLMAGLDTTGRLVATHLRGLAGLFALELFSAGITCSDSCAPAGVVRVTHSMSYAVRGAQGDYFPSIGFDWILCCACPCYYVFTEQRRETCQWWGQITALTPFAEREAAIREATRLGREMAGDYNTALTNGKPYSQPDGITPRFEAPECSCFVL
ncbi:MAG: hypothetical protein AB7S92_19005 [Parvibaculaceae bacterium]